MNKGKYWKQMEEIHSDEPIIESDDFDQVKWLLQDWMENGTNHSAVVWDLLTNGANEYIEECMKNDPTIINEGQAGDDLEEEDRAKRNSDLIKDELRRNTAAIYGV